MREDKVRRRGHSYVHGSASGILRIEFTQPRRPRT